MANLLERASIVLTPTAYNNGEALCVKPEDGSGDFQFSRATEATRVNSLGLVEVVADNLPRINYEGFSYDGSGNIIPDSGCGSWLFEPQSTNLIPYSEDFSNSAWSKIGASVVGGFDSPDGGANAFKLVEGTNTGVHFLFDSASVLNGSTNYNSIYVKPNGVNWVKLYDGAKNEGIYFDLQNKVIGTKSAGVLDYSIVELSDGWLRIGFSSVATSTSVIFRVYLAPANNTLSYTGDGTSGVYIFGAQVEQQSYATSYIPTDGTQKTRNQDVCTNGGSVSTINSTSGVLYAEIAALADDGTNRIICISDGTNGNRVQIYYSTTTNSLIGLVASGGSTVASLNTTLSNTTDITKVAVKYRLNDFALWVNGVEVAVDISGNPPIGLDRLDFRLGVGILPFYGRTKTIAVFSEVLTDEELTLLTTI